MDQAFERDSVSRGIVYQYANTITAVLAGFLFYIYIIHFFPPEIVGVVALLLAIASLFNIVFTLGLRIRCSALHLIPSWKERA